LLAGTLLVAETLQPECHVYGVEPSAGDDGRQSLRRGERVHIAVPVTIADGAQTQQLGELTFPVIRRAVHDILAVGDAALLRQMHQLATRMKLLVEPTGCLGLAGAEELREQLAGKRIGVILSGGNVDPGAFPTTR
jgi:threonine dehydratase